MNQEHVLICFRPWNSSAFHYKIKASRIILYDLAPVTTMISPLSLSLTLLRSNWPFCYSSNKAPSYVQTVILSRILIKTSTLILSSSSILQKTSIRPTLTILFTYDPPNYFQYFSYFSTCLWFDKYCLLT